MSGFHHRDLGAAGAVLYLKDFSAEIIADGMHVSPEAINLFLNQKAPEKIFVITDALSPTGKKEGQHFCSTSMLAYYFYFSPSV